MPGVSGRLPFVGGGGGVGVVTSFDKVIIW